VEHVAQEPDLVSRAHLDGRAEVALDHAPRGMASSATGRVICLAIRIPPQREQRRDQ
jgi:hypothetical protein